MKPWIFPAVRFRYRSRSVRVTPEGIVFFFLAVLVGTTAINTGNNLLYLLMALMLTLIIISGILSEWCLKGLEVEHRFPTQIYAQEPVGCRWMIRNRKSLFPTFALSVSLHYQEDTPHPKMRVLHLAPAGTQYHTSTFQFGRRGLYRLRGYELATAFPFGLFEKSLFLPSSGEVLVYPRLQRIWAFEGAALLGGDAQEAKRKGLGSGLHSLRGYQEGDDSRNIHWKVSARQAKLFVKEHEQEDVRKVQICLNNQLPLAVSPADPEAFEEAVSLAASMAHHLAQKGYAVGLSTVDLEVQARPGMSHCSRILNLLARVTALPPRSSGERLAGRFGPRSHQAILIMAWEDPSWKPRETSFTKVVTLSEWKQGLERHEIQDPAG